MKDSAPVISSEVPFRPWYKRKHVLIDLAVILLVIVIIAVVWWVGHRPKPEPAPSVPQFSGQALVDEVNKKLSDHDYNGAIKLLKGQKSISEPDTQILLAGAYANKQNYEAAVDVYEKVEKSHDMNANDVATAGDVAALAGDKEAAVGFYRQAIERTDPKASPTGADQIAIYQAKIANLESQ